jgi:hypothetical protein
MCNSGAFLAFNDKSNSPSKILIEKSGTICSAILLFPAKALPGFGFNFEISTVTAFNSSSEMENFS